MDPSAVIRYRNHSTFSKIRVRKWQEGNLFERAFYEVAAAHVRSDFVDDTVIQKHTTSEMDPDRGAIDFSVVILCCILWKRGNTG